MIEKTVWYDEEDFTLDVHVNLQNVNLTGYMEKEKNLMFQMRTCLRPQIRCEGKLWFPMQSLGTAPRNLFVNENGIEVNKENYCKHLKKQLFPAIKKLVMKA